MRVVFTHLIGPRKGESERFDSSTISIGRAPDNALRFTDHKRVSSHHARMTLKGNSYELRDLGSTNGTMINGRRVAAAILNPEDLIEFGAGGPLLRFGVERDGDGASAAYRPAPERPTANSDSNPPSPARNTMLVLALSAAMVFGGIGGVLLSGRLRAADPAPMSFAEVAERNSGAVVFIRTQFELVDESGDVTLRDARSGSGFIVSPTGLIVTNRHLIRDWEYADTPPGSAGRTTSIEVILPGEKLEHTIPAHVYRLSESPDSDVAILKIDAFSPIATVYGFEPDLSRISQGEEAAVIGYPLGTELIQTTRDKLIDNSLCAGVVSRVGQNDIQLSLRVYHGNSGGPVLNRKGEVIGILTATLANAQDLAVATPIAKALDLIRGDQDYQQD